MGIYAQGGFFTRCNVVVSRYIIGAETISADINGAKIFSNSGFFRDAINNTARTTATKQKCVWATKNFNLVKII